MVDTVGNVTWDLSSQPNFTHMLIMSLRASRYGDALTVVASQEREETGLLCSCWATLGILYLLLNTEALQRMFRESPQREGSEIQIA